MPVADRFWGYVDKESEAPCWIWTGARVSRGYGVTSKNHRNIPAHRWSYEDAHGPIPSGMFILHSCDNPPCVNPAHLRPGTQKENLADAVERKRTLRGGANVNARFTDEEAEAVRTRYRAGGVRQRDLAVEYGVSEVSIWKMLNGISYRAGH